MIFILIFQVLRQPHQQIQLLLQPLLRQVHVQLVGRSLRKTVTNTLTPLSSGKRQGNTVCLRRFSYWIVLISYNSILQADLASIHSEEENNFLLNIIGSTWTVWVGGLRTCPDGCKEFEWTDGTQMDFTAWHKVQPDHTVYYIISFIFLNYCNSKGGAENCMEMNWHHQGSSGWNDISCDRSDRGRFMCKKSNRGG